MRASERRRIQQLVALYYQDPTRFNENEINQIGRLAQMAGIPFTPYTTSPTRSFGIGAGELLDAASMGFVPNSWKLSPRTGAESAIRTAATGIGAIVPGLLGAVLGAKLSKAAKLAEMAERVGTRLEESEWKIAPKIAEVIGDKAFTERILPGVLIGGGFGLGYSAGAGGNLLGGTALGGLLAGVVASRYKGADKIIERMYKMEEEGLGSLWSRAEKENKATKGTKSTRGRKRKTTK